MKQKFIWSCASACFFVVAGCLSALALANDYYDVPAENEIVSSNPLYMPEVDVSLFDDAQEKVSITPGTGEVEMTKMAEPEPIKTTARNRTPVGQKIYQPLMIPNDPSSAQWWTSTAKFEQAWDIPPGSRQTTLAIIDTGFALNHEEFANRWYQNSGELGSAASEQPSKQNCTGRGLPLDGSCNLIDDDFDSIVDNETGTADYENPSRLNCTARGLPITKDCNLIDDDDNGYVDDVTGWDFVNYDSSVKAGELNPNGSGTYHGTLVTGAAASTGNNSKGMAGADWNVKILPLQALDDDSYGNSNSVARSIRYAIRARADVINLSLGSNTPDTIVRDAVREAIAAGIVVVAATGNDGCECMFYPANYPEVLAVGALNSSGNRASFSNYGANLDILAPGSNIYTTDWLPNNQTSAYGYGSGTSLATPVVSGLLTRLLSHQPNEKASQLLAGLTESTNKSLLGGAIHNNTAGFGTLDALAASSRLTSPAISPQTYVFSSISNGSQMQLEPANSAYAYSCSNPTTAMHELTKGSTKFFTISKAELSKAIETGYSSRFFSYVCVGQPHDQPSSIRALNVFREFNNTSPKP